MKRNTVRSLVLVLAVAAGSASAQEYYDDSYGDEQGYAYGNDQGYAYGDQDAGYYGDEARYAQPVQYAAQPGYYDNQGPAYGRRVDAYGQRGADYDVARVLSVDPIVEHSRPVARQECWSEPSQTYAGNYRPQPRRTSGAGAVIGAIIGGAIGSTVDDDRGRHRGYYGRHRGGRDNDGAIVAGAVIGGVIGNGIERQNQYRDGGYRGQPAGYYQQPVQRCRVVNEHVGDQRVSGYRVSYEYAGRTYETVTDYHPGSEIRVRVQVTPEG